MIDTTAILALMRGSPEARAIARAIAADPRRLVSACTVLEVGIALEIERGEAAGRELDLLLHRIAAEVVPFTRVHCETAREAWRRYGAPANAARPGFAAYCAWAVASGMGEPLLATGGLFSGTEVPTVALTTS